MEAVDFICSKCKHYDRATGTCAAFPDEIPDEIVSGDNKHSKPLQDQQNNIVFTPADNE